MTYRNDNPYQTAGDVYYPLRVVLFIGLLSMGFILSKPNSAKTNVDDLLLLDTSLIEMNKPLPWQQRASEKAVKQYAAAQDKKWQRWNEAMFERKR